MYRLALTQLSMLHSRVFTSRTIDIPNQTFLAMSSTRGIAVFGGTCMLAAGIMYYVHITESETRFVSPREGGASMVTAALVSTPHTRARYGRDANGTRVTPLYQAVPLECCTLYACVHCVGRVSHLQALPLVPCRLVPCLLSHCLNHPDLVSWCRLACSAENEARAEAR